MSTLTPSSFAPPSPEREQAQLRERLTTLAAELGLKAGRHGVTVSDLRISAAAKGWLTGQESEAAMNALKLGQVMRSAGLVSTKQMRRSSVPQAKCSPNAIYVIREFAEAVA